MNAVKLLAFIRQLVCFGGACAPVNFAHPSFWAHCHTKRLLDNLIVIRVQLDCRTDRRTDIKIVPNYSDTA